MSDDFDEFEELSLDDIEVDVDSETGFLIKKPLDLSSGPKDPPKTINGSATAIKNYQKCPAMRYASITHQPMQEKSPALVTGSGIHEGLEMFAKEEKDPHKVYDEYMKRECAKNEITLEGPKAIEMIETGHRCIAAGVSILSKPVGPNKVPYYKTIEKKDIERPFVFHRNGFKFTGFFDLVARVPGTKDIVFNDYKSGSGKFDSPFKKDETKSELPAKASHVLNRDVQFSIYFKGIHDDETPGSDTKGIWPLRGNWIHLQGKSLQYALLQKDCKSGKKGDKSNKRVSVKDADPDKVQYIVPTFRTPDEVEEQFVSTIDPIMENMQAGRWWRTEGSHCEKICSYFDKKKMRCAVELPSDSARKLREANEISLLSKNLKEKK